MKKTLYGLLCCASLCHTSMTFAGDQVGIVSQFIARGSDNLHLVILQGTPHNNKPACAKNYDYWMIANENSAAGKTQISMIMTALAQQKELIITGTNTCSRWGDGESIENIIIR